MTRRGLWVAATLCALGAGPVGAQSLQAGRDSLRIGAYDAAIRILSRVARNDTTWVAAQRELARALATVGRYDDAEATARRAAEAPGGAAALNTLGEILIARGRRAAAESVFTRAVAARAPDSLTADLNLALARYEDGDHAGALHGFDHFIDVYNTRADQLTSREMTAVAIAVEHLGETNPDLFQDAVRAFDRAIDLDGGNVEARDALGEMFLAKYNSADAQTTFDGALAIDPKDPRALVGAARRAAFDGQPGADSLITRALAVNPNDVAALTFRASQLLDLENYAAARQDVERALRVNPNSVNALAVEAGIAYATDDQPAFEAVVRRATAANPGDASFYTQMAELAGNIRLYSAAAQFAEQAVRTDPRAWHAYAVRGMNQLRLGEIATGRASLDTAFTGDPYDVWTKNTLDLLDTFKNYDTIHDGPFEFMIEKDESAVLGIYLDTLARQAYARYSTQFDYRPTGTIRIEVYRSRADFSVRTVGLTGLGALGVTFGNTIAMDSPAAKDAGPFNWGSTAWHELAHTFTLGVSDHRVPRWLSEGLSVWEEHHGLAGWGSHVSAGFLRAFRQGKLVPVSRMNDGFIRPAYPEQVLYSYYEASLVCDLIARDFGTQAFVRMLLDYKAGKSTADVFHDVLHTDPAAFDARFTAYLKQRFAGELAATADDSTSVDPRQAPAELVRRADAAPGDFRVQLLVGQALIQHADTGDAIRVLERARALFPQFSAPDGPYTWLAHAYEHRGQWANAATVLRDVTDYDEADDSARLDLAHVLEQTGDSAGAVRALEGAIYVNPFQPSVHEQLAELAAALGNHVIEVRERQALVALAPVDLAGALYRLALAQHRAGDDSAAKATVLQSLAHAPNYAEAQELLLTIVNGGKVP